MSSGLRSMSPVYHVLLGQRFLTVTTLVLLSQVVKPKKLD